MQSQFEKSTLLAIRRQFTENEAVGFLSQQLANANVEIGMLKSELAEIKDPFEKQISDLKQTVATLQEFLKEKNEKVAELQKKCNERAPPEIRELRQLVKIYQKKLGIKND